MSFDANYNQTPFNPEITENKQQTWIQWELMNMYQRQSVYSQHAGVITTSTPTNSPTLTYSDLIAPKPNTNQVDPYIQWLPSSYIDSYTQTISFKNYAGKLAYHKEDNMFTAWKRNNVTGLAGILRQALGQMIIDQFDTLARNKMLENPLKSYGINKSNFASLTVTDLLAKSTLKDIWLSLNDRESQWQNLHDNTSPTGLICLTSNGAISDLMENLRALPNAELTPVDQYKSVALKGEVFSHENIRFVGSPLAVLWNAGPIAQRKDIKLAIFAGEGSPDPRITLVDGVYAVGQGNRAGIKFYLQLNTVTGLAVGDMITVHTALTSAFGVTDGVDFRDSKTVHRRIVAIDAPNFRIQLSKPIMEDFTTDLGGTVFGYVTLGRNVHTSIFIGGNTGVVLAMARGLEIYTPPAVDDTMSMHRFTFDWRGAYNIFRPEDIHVHFHAGTNARYTGGSYIS